MAEVQQPLTLAITNRKGGSGKTTTAVNLAAEWGRQGHRVLLIDLDSQGHAAIGVGCRAARRSEEHVHQLLHRPELALMDVVQLTPIRNVCLAPANTDFCAQELPVSILKQALQSEAVAMAFDRVVLDTPPTMDSVLISALVAAHSVLVPFVPHHLSAVGVRQLAKLFYKVATLHNPDLRLLGLLPIMMDRKLKLQQRVMADLGQQFGRERILRGIRSNIKLAEAFEAGEPIFSYAPRSSGAMDYQLMAEEIELLIEASERCSDEKDHVGG